MPVVLQPLSKVFCSFLPHDGADGDAVVPFRLVWIQSTDQRTQNQRKQQGHLVGAASDP